MWRDRGRDQPIVLESLDEGVGTLKLVGRRLRVWNRKLDDRLPQHTAQSRGPGLGSDLLFEVIHVRVEGCARADHFQRRQPGADANELRRYRLGLGREYVL